MNEHLFQEFFRVDYLLESVASISICFSSYKGTFPWTLYISRQDCDIQEKLDFEMRMRAGAYKLLVASTKKEQVLDASRSLLTCNARIKAYMNEAQMRNGHLESRRLVIGGICCVSPFPSI